MIVKTPGVCGGRARIAGTRIPVWAIANCAYLGIPDSEILDIYPSLRAEDIRDAVEYTKSNVEEIVSDCNANLS